MQSYRTRDTLPDCSTGEGLEQLGEHITRYPDICPFCFSKYPDDEIKKVEHIIACNKILRSIRYDQSLLRR
jgi:hypothetical protein